MTQKGYWHIYCYSTDDIIKFNVEILQQLEKVGFSRMHGNHGLQRTIEDVLNLTDVFISDSTNSIVGIYSKPYFSYDDGFAQFIIIIEGGYNDKEYIKDIVTSYQGKTNKAIYQTLRKSESDRRLSALSSHWKLIIPPGLVSLIIKILEYLRDNSIIEHSVFNYLIPQPKHLEILVYIFFYPFLFYIGSFFLITLLLRTKRVWIEFIPFKIPKLRSRKDRLRYRKILTSSFDLILASILIIVLFPYFLLLSLVIVITSGRPIFYKSLRQGVNNKTFGYYKFRTAYNIRRYSSKVKKLSSSSLTPIGKILRRTGLDTLPSLFNILNGTMSFVGPFPLGPDELLLIQFQVDDHNDTGNITTSVNMSTDNISKSDFDSWKETLRTVKPGLTGIWQISREVGSMSQLIQLEREYYGNRTFWTDLKILVKSVFIVLAKR